MNISLPGDFYRPFGDTTFTFSSTTTFLGGDDFYVANNGTNDQLGILQSYVSNTPISATAPLPGNFASLGVTPASVVMSLPGDQTVTMQFESLTAEVPAPDTLALLLGGLAVAGGLTARRRRRI